MNQKSNLMPRFWFTTPTMGDLGEPTHTLIPCWMSKPLPPRIQCTGWFAPATMGDVRKTWSSQVIVNPFQWGSSKVGGCYSVIFPNWTPILIGVWLGEHQKTNTIKTHV
jgi:hypothetical protein